MFDSLDNFRSSHARGCPDVTQILGHIPCARIFRRVLEAGNVPEECEEVPQNLMGPIWPHQVARSKFCVAQILGHIPWSQKPRNCMLLHETWLQEPTRAGSIQKRTIAGFWLTSYDKCRGNGAGTLQLRHI